jgi:molybdopterin molybdotransferase
VREALRTMSGMTEATQPLLRAACVTPLRKKPGRTEYQRGIVTRENGNKDGRWQVAITGSQGSGILSSMSAANGMVVLHHEQGNVNAGDEVDVIPFDGLV